MKNIFLLLLILCVNSVFGASESYIAELDERLTDLELKSLAQKIKVGVELDSYGAAYDVDSSDFESGNLKKTTFKNSFRLLVSGSVTDNLNVYGSLSASYFYNDDLQTNALPNIDRAQAEYGNRPYLETAFFDYRVFGSPVSISAGRLPTTNGPPEHFRQGVNRKGTYPNSQYSLPIDGVALTVDWHNLFGLKTSIISRTIYVPGSNADYNYPDRQEAYDPANPKKMTESSKGFSQMIEIEKVINTRQKVLTILQGSYYSFGSFRSVEAKGLFPGQVLVPGVITVPADDTNTYRLYADHSKITDYKVASIYSEWTGILNSGFDGYFNYTRSVMTPRGSLKAKVLDSKTTNLANGTVLDMGGFLVSEKSVGNRYLFGTKYNFKKLALGTEFWFTTGTSAPTDIFSDDMLKLGLYQGQVYHGFATYNATPSVSLRGGYFNINQYQRLKGGLKYVDIDDRTQAVYFGIGIQL